MEIPILDLSPEIKMMRAELDAAYHKVMEHGQFIMGPEVREFEESAAKYLGVKHAIGVNSGTDALVIALRALGIGEDPNDEVITTPFTFFATAESISITGAKPVFIDIDERTYNLDPHLIEKAITKNTKAIMPVHLYGRPAAMNLIMEIAKKHNLYVVEDCAQSFGAVYHHPKCVECDGNCSSDSGSAMSGKMTGTIGEVGAFSFFPSKNLGAFGDAGLIATNNDDLAELARKLRAHGSIKKYHNEILGYNSRLDTLQAAFLNVKINYLNEFNERRRTIAQRYSKAFSSVEGIIPPTLSDNGHVYHQYTVRIQNGQRDAVAEKLKQAGIGTMIYYPVPSHKLPVYSNNFADLRLPVCDQLTEEVLSLPIFPMMTEEQQDVVIGEVLLSCEL